MCIVKKVIWIIILAITIYGSGNAYSKDNTKILVYGKTVSIDGKLLPGIKGCCQSQESGRLNPYWTSGKDGKFQLQLAPGTYKIWANHAMSKTIVLRVKKGDKPLNVNVIGSPHNGLLLSFRDSNGKILSNATLSYGIEGGMGHLTTDVYGNAIAPSQGYVPFRMFFVLKKVGYADLNITKENIIFGNDPFIVQLNKGPFISGRIVSKKNNTPIGGIPIIPERQYMENDQWSRWNSQFGFKSYKYTVLDKSIAISRDGDGEFMLGPIPPGTYNLLIGIPLPEGVTPVVDLVEPGKRVVNVSQGIDIKGIEISSEIKNPAFTLKGKVLMNNKIPLASKEIAIKISRYYVPGNEPEEYYLWEPITRIIVTDSKGNYMLYPVRPGKYTITAVWGKYSGKKIVSVKADNNSLDFVLKDSQNKAIKR